MSNFKLPAEPPVVWSDEEYTALLDRYAKLYTKHCDLLVEREAPTKDAIRYRWLVANAENWSYQPGRYNSTTVSGFAANGTGYLGYTFEQGVDLAMEKT